MMQERPRFNEGERPTMIWIKKGSNIMPRPVKTGMSDGAYKIIESGVNEGDSVVLSAQYVVKEAAKKTGENPFMPGPPGRNRNNRNNNRGGAPQGGPGPRPGTAQI